MITLLSKNPTLSDSELIEKSKKNIEAIFLKEKSKSKREGEKEAYDFNGIVHLRGFQSSWSFVEIEGTECLRFTSYMDNDIVAVRRGGEWQVKGDFVPQEFYEMTSKTLKRVLQ